MVNQVFVISSLFLIVVFFKEATAIKCWQCSSDSKYSQYGSICGDRFDYSLVTEEQRRANLRECPPVNTGYDTQNLNYNQYQYNYVPACQKKKQYVYGNLVVVRSCVQYNRNDRRDKCVNDNYAPGISNEFCEVCDDKDGCNGAKQYGPIAILILLPILLAKLLTL